MGEEAQGTPLSASHGAPAARQPTAQSGGRAQAAKKIFAMRAAFAMLGPVRRRKGDHLSSHAVARTESSIPCRRNLRRRVLPCQPPIQTSEGAATTRMGPSPRRRTGLRASFTLPHHARATLGSPARRLHRRRMVECTTRIPIHRLTTKTPTAGRITARTAASSIRFRHRRRPSRAYRTLPATNIPRASSPLRLILDRISPRLECRPRRLSADRP